MIKKIKQKLTPHNGAKKVLLHSCYAPCAGSLMESMVEAGISLTILFYNPNKALLSKQGYFDLALDQFSDIGSIIEIKLGEKENAKLESRERNCC